MGDVEHGSVVYFGVFGDATAELFGVPSIEVGIEMKDCYAAPG